jgi:pentatricopeptide repeat protein
MPPSRQKPAAETFDANRYFRAADERLSIDPRDADALFTAAAFLARQGKLEAAARLYEDMEEERLASLCLARASMTA